MTKRVLILVSALLVSLLINAQNVLIPRPVSQSAGVGYFSLNEKTTISSNEKSSFNLNYLKNKLEAATGFKIDNKKSAENSIVLSLVSDQTIKPEGYILEITQAGVAIKASSSAGIFYGIQSLLQLMPASVYSGKSTAADNWKLASVKIEDYPRFGYRGMMLDVSRTFFDAGTVKRYIEWLSYHKINTLHWHLTDDNGWRVEIKKYPLLTERGAWRGDGEALAPSFGSGKGRYGGFYTQDEIKEIVKFAADRNIEIVPEIDLPGHSKAVTATYPNVGCDHSDNSLSVQGEGQNVWCVGKEDNYKMLDNIIKELSKLFPGKYIHIGGDEVNYTTWDNCPSCKALKEKEGMKTNEELLNYFVRRMEKIVEKHGKKMAGWDEILEGGDLHKETRVYAWRSVDKGIESVKKGQPTIMMPGAYCYFDMKYTPMERGHNWAGIVSTEKTYSLDPTGTASLSPEEAPLVVGVQGALWTELLGWPPKFLDYQTYPRLTAVAEIGWSPQEIRNWDDFNYRLESFHYNRMANMGISFRLPFPEVSYENGALRVKLPYEWAIVRYTTDESEPTMYSPVYKGEIFTDKPERFRFATFFKDDIKSITVKASNADYKYLTPEVEITTNLEEGKNNKIVNITDYKFDTYFRTTRKLAAGDYLTYSFKEPVKSSRITVESGMPNIDFYWINDGYVEYSYDGVTFIKGDDLKRGTATIIPQEPVKAVRIKVTAPNDGYIAAFRDLKIE
ncbi:MAG: family 20 glycosylhydrolase [Bacteroidales bacterium]|jgi:hexosaminidase|nr:family 20 glycosylhydrolase [Bacteroidales bacterium]